MLCCLCVAFAARRDCYVLRCCALRLLRAVLAVCCAGYVLRLLCAVLATCCDCCVLRCCVIRLYIYIVCNSSLYAVLLYILCLLCAVLAVRFVSIYILCAIRHYMSPAHAIPAETVQLCKEKATYTP